MHAFRRRVALASLALGSGSFQTPVGAAPASDSHAPSSAEYQGKPFADTVYRMEQQADAEAPRSPYRAFVPAQVVFTSKAPHGSGWVGNDEPAASIGLDEPGGGNPRTIHYRVSLPNYRYAAFGWQWRTPEEDPVDLRAYDAVSFSIKITGARKPQELFFGLSELQPAPISLREYDPEFADGSWHHLTIPVRAMKWTDAGASVREVRAFVFKTFVWDPSDYDIQLDEFTLDRAVKPFPPQPPAPPASPASIAPNHGQTIPGKLECAFYDLGGEGVAYHDTTPINILSGVLNQQRGHQRAHATSYHWNFRRAEGVDISFVKDWADLNHPNPVDPPTNQLYIGGTEDEEWCNYTVEVTKAGTFKIIAAYGNVADAKPIRFSLDGRPAAECRFPVVTGSMHTWNRAEVGTITFPKAGVHRLTLHYGRGYNLGYFEFAELP